ADAPDARRAPADIPIDANVAARSGPDPAAAIAFHWRASLADIEQDCAFSTFPGCDRQLVLVSGEGALLHCADDSTLPLQPPHGRAAFSGGESVHSTVQGRVVVCNLIAARDRVQAQLLHRPLVGPMLFFPEPGVQ